MTCHSIRCLSVRTKKSFTGLPVYLQISMGNHKVTMFPQNSADSHIHVYHYNIRGKQQFMEKMINGGKQLEQHKADTEVATGATSISYIKKEN